MDFLIWQGHDSAAVQQMTLRQIELWNGVACDRLKNMYADTGGKSGRAEF